MDAVWICRNFMDVVELSDFEHVKKMRSKDVIEPGRSKGVVRTAWT